MERVLSSSRGIIKFDDVGVSREISCDIPKASVNHSSSARGHFHKCAYTGCDAWKQHRNDWKNTLEH